MDMASESHSQRSSSGWLAWKGWTGVGFSLPSFPGLSMTKSSQKPKRGGGQGSKTPLPLSTSPFGEEQHGKWGAGGPNIDIELLSLICGVAYAMVGRCNPASVDGEAGRTMEHAATKGGPARKGCGGCGAQPVGFPGNRQKSG